MGRCARKTFGFFCIGPTYVCIKRVAKSNSLVGSGIYSTIGGWLGTGAYKCLRSDVVSERLEQLLAQEDPDIAPTIRGLLYEKFPQLEKRVQKEDYSIQELKRQIMREKGYRNG